MKIAITGHRYLSDPNRVRQQLAELLKKYEPPLVGISSLAIGADQIFADEVLKVGGTLMTVVPMPEYPQTFTPSELLEYERLLAVASEVEILPAAETDEDSFFEAGKRVVDLCDLLIAVWDGLPAKGRGGTGDVVEYAVATCKPYLLIKP